MIPLNSLTHNKSFVTGLSIKNRIRKRSEHMQLDAD